MSRPAAALLLALTPLTWAGCGAGAGGGKGSRVRVLDDENGQPVPHVPIFAESFSPRGRGQYFKGLTDAEGRVRLPWATDDPHAIHVDHPEYVSGGYRVESGPGPHDYVLHVGRPIVIEVELVLPDDRRAVLNIHEGMPLDGAPPGLRDRIEPKRISVPVQWDGPPPPFPKSDPMLRLNLYEVSPHRGVESVVHKVTRARTTGGGELPVYRDGVPPDGGFGVYFIGRNGFGDSVFVVGKLSDAREAEAVVMRMQWQPNRAVLGPA